MHFLKVSSLLLIIFCISTCQETPKQNKLFGSLKTAKVNKGKLSLIIKKLNPNNKSIPGIKKCPAFTKYSHCACEPTCNNPKPVCSFCQGGCVCRNGFVKNLDNQCILPEQCDQGSRIFEIPPTTRIYEAIPVETTTPKPQPTTEQIETTPMFENLTHPLIVLRSGPTPPSAPPMLNTRSIDREMIGAPSATPPPDFSYGPPGMNSARYALYDDYLKQKRIMNALERRRARFFMRKL